MSINVYHLPYSVLLIPFDPGVSRKDVLGCPNGPNRQIMSWDVPSCHGMSHPVIGGPKAPSVQQISQSKWSYPVLGCPGISQSMWSYPVLGFLGYPSPSGPTLSWDIPGPSGISRSKWSYRLGMSWDIPGCSLTDRNSRLTYM